MYTPWLIWAAFAHAAPPEVTLAIGAREEFTEGSFVEGGTAGVRLGKGVVTLRPWFVRV